MIKKVKTLCAYIILSILFGSGIFGFNVLSASAYVGFSTLSEQELYNATNTYNISENCFDDEGRFQHVTEHERIDNEEQYHLSYNMQQKNSNKDNVMNFPQITVLTHGLGSTAGVWSNHYSKDSTNTAFAYDPMSLISKIKSAAGGANIYWANIKADYKFRLYDITTQESETSTYIRSKEVDRRLSFRTV